MSRNFEWFYGVTPHALLERTINYGRVVFVSVILTRRKWSTKHSISSTHHVVITALKHITRQWKARDFPCVGEDSHILSVLTGEK